MPDPAVPGCRLRLRVSAGAARSRILGAHAGALKLSVKAPPERGRANGEAVRLVAALFDLSPSEVSILKGETSPDKVAGLALAPDEAARRWAARSG